MTKQLVYRIEHHESGTGPYRGNPSVVSDALVEMYNRHNWSQHHPCGRREFGPEIMAQCGGYLYGFATLDQYKEWFDGFFDLLKQHGFILTQYAIKAKKYCRHGAKQTIFDPENAKEIGKFCPVSLQPLAA